MGYPPHHFEFKAPSAAVVEWFRRIGTAKLPYHGFGEDGSIYLSSPELEYDYDWRDWVWHMHSEETRSYSSPPSWGGADGGAKGAETVRIVRARVRAIPVTNDCTMFEFDSNLDGFVGWLTSEAESYQGEKESLHLISESSKAGSTPQNVRDWLREQWAHERAKPDGGRTPYDFCYAVMDEYLEKDKADFLRRGRPYPVDREDKVTTHNRMEGLLKKSLKL